MTPPARKASSPRKADAPAAGPALPDVDARAVALQARQATGGGRANLAGVLRADGVLRVVGSSIGPLAAAWRRATELAQEGQRPLVVEVDTNGNIRVHTDPDGAEAPVDVELGEGLSA
jgi:hypothetical protein